MFAWQVAKFVKSNAIVLARGGATLGVGAGQMSRVYSTRIAALKAADEKLRAARRGAWRRTRTSRFATASMSRPPMASRRSSIRAARCAMQEVIAAADEHGMAMVFTGMRHFRH